MPSAWEPRVLVTQVPGIVGCIWLEKQASDVCSACDQVR